MCDQPDFYAERMVRARKVHKCCECRREIQVGETYQRINGKWEEIETFATCESCVALRESFQTVSVDECQLIGELFRSINEAEDWFGHPLFERNADGVPVALIAKDGTQCHT